MKINEIIIESLTYGVDDVYDSSMWSGILDLEGLTEEEIEDKVDNYLDKFHYIDEDLIEYDLDRGFESLELIFKFEDKLYRCDYTWAPYEGYDTDGICTEVEPYTIEVTKYRPCSKE